jgi:hypothetical protein
MQLLEATQLCVVVEFAHGCACLVPMRVLKSGGRGGRKVGDIQCAKRLHLEAKIECARPVHSPSLSSSFPDVYVEVRRAIILSEYTASLRTCSRGSL